MLSIVNLFIAFQSGPSNQERRATLREWLQPLVLNNDSFTIAYRIFSDNCLADLDQSENVVLPASIRYQPSDWMYHYTRRWLYELEWSFRNFNYSWYMRMDDDVFLCVPNFLQTFRGFPATGHSLVFANYFNMDDHEKCAEALLDNPGRSFQQLSCWPDFVKFDECWFMMSSDVVAGTLSKIASDPACEPWYREDPTSYMRRLYLGADDDWEQNAEAGAPGRTSLGEHCSSQPWLSKHTMAMDIGTRLKGYGGEDIPEVPWGRAAWTARRSRSEMQAICSKEDLIYIHNQGIGSSIHRDEHAESQETCASIDEGTDDDAQSCKRIGA
eukprot:TRINITY_DN48574_c0_g1_i1.p1 TRINITY_DN48574_c0_g1~~TRINITY_DN48574_c0_g1_i1.p1  ORF type:complete len:327 (-),score=34.02 TRINITY_DN48574_c0_g1_i1:388-1368(-)